MAFLPKLGTFDMSFCFKDSFKLLSFSNIFTEESYQILQKGFELLEWEHKESHFYRQYSSKIRPNHNNPFAGFFQADFFFPFKSKLERFLGVPLRNTFSMVAHKLITSQEIGVHNDFCDPILGYENFRFIFQFAKREKKCSGGEIAFLRSEDKNTVIRKYSYSENEGICFEITPSSYHFVEPVEEGERCTLVMYLWDATKYYDGSGIEITNV